MWVYWQEKSIPSGCCDSMKMMMMMIMMVMILKQYCYDPFFFLFKSVYLQNGLSRSSLHPDCSACCISILLLEKQRILPKVKQTFQMLLWLFWCTLSEVGLFWLCCVMIKVLVDCPFEILKFWLEMFLFYRFTFTIIFRFIPLNDMLAWCSMCVCKYFINSTVHEGGRHHCWFVCLFVRFPEMYEHSSYNWKKQNRDHCLFMLQRAFVWRCQGLMMNAVVREKRNQMLGNHN